MYFPSSIAANHSLRRTASVRGAEAVGERDLVIPFVISRRRFNAATAGRCASVEQQPLCARLHRNVELD